MTSIPFGGSHVHPVRRRIGQWWSALCVLPLALGLAPMLGAQPVASAPRPIVHVIPIEGMIDMGLAPFVDRVLKTAAADGAALVILDINTFGGRVDAAVAIRDALLSTELRTVAFINRRAISAGALISLAATDIVMADGGTIGAATPVQIGGSGEAKEQPKAIEEKSISYVRKEFRATADARGRDPVIAEAMVDADVVIDTLIAKGKLLTLTTDEALERGIADLRANSIAALLDSLGFADADIRRQGTNWGEALVRLLTNPIVASLLLSVGTLGILLELRTPGVGLPGAVGLASLALVLGGHYLVALVGWEELLLVGVGFLLIGLEVFVIPGFGVAGVVGILSILGGMTMGLVGVGASTTAVVGTLSRLGIALTGAVIAAVILFRVLGSRRMGRRLLLETELDADDGFASAPERDKTWLGRTGRTTSPLRPAGYADLDGERVDVVSDGEMLDAGVEIVVVRVDGNRIVVRKHHATHEGV
jgi:membrane-bound serine protease (ClpP class)